MTLPINVFNVSEDKSVSKWKDIISYFRWCPDLFYDMITPETGGIVLDIDQRVYLRAMARFISNYAVFPRGYGKCQSSDTLIITDSGIKELGSFFEYDTSKKERYIRTGFNIVNRYNKLETTNAGVYSGFLPTKKVITEEGYGVECTNNHPMLVMRDGKIDWVKSEDIRVGDFLPVSRGANIWGSNTTLNTDVDGHFKSMNLSNQSFSGIMRGKCNTPTELTEEMALVIGYLIGDGTLTRNNRITLTNIDEDIINNYSMFIENTIGLHVTHSKNGIDHHVNGMYIREYFRQIGLTQSNALTKEVPQCIFSAPSNIVASFIRGLFDTDGGLSNSYIEYATSSEKLSKQIQVILANFGIISTRKVRQTKRNPSYRITIYGKNMDLFLQTIGFSCKRKQDKLVKLCNGNRNVNKDIIPFQKDIVNRFYNSHKMLENGPIEVSESGKPRYLIDKLYHVLSGNNELTYEKLDLMLSLSNAYRYDGYNELLELKNLNYFYSKVERIEDSENHVYDLSVPGTHSFISNGLISHNTMLELMALYHMAIFFPRTMLSMTAQTEEAAVKILKDKHSELVSFYPILQNEFASEPKFSKDSATIMFKNGSRIDVLANNQASKGQRRHRLMVEEAALLNNATFQDALRPVTSVPRRTIGRNPAVNPYELNGQINFLTTSGKYCPFALKDASNNHVNL
jgi:ribonucleoside-diphosphate reductase alpha chain